MPVFGSECSSVLIDPRIWYQTKPVTDLQTSKPQIRARFLESISGGSLSWALVGSKKQGKGGYSSSWEPHLRATGRHLPYGITQC